MRIMNRGLVALLFFILVTGIVSATEEDTFAEAETLISQKVSCSDLAEDQLESIGDYVMGLRHPGEAHKIMDQMMGGEGSAQLRAAHIAMARLWYCRDARYGGYSEMGMMGAMGMISNMMFNTRGGMMNMVWNCGFGTGTTGMMGYGFGIWWLLSWLIGIGIVVLVWLWVMKLWREVVGKKKK